MSEQPAPVVVGADRWKSARLFLFSVAFFLGGLYILAGDKDHRAGLFVCVFFGGLAVLQLVDLVRPARLTLDENGFRIDGLWPRRVAWSEVAGFRLTQLRRSSFLVIDYREPAPGEQRRRRRPGGIPNMLRQSPEQVLDLLLEGLERARLTNPGSRPAAAIEAVREFPEPPRVIPWLSLGLAIVLSLAFFAEIEFPVLPASGTLQPSIDTLAAFGGLVRQLVLGQGEWFRVATSPFLHGSLTHLLLNLFALLLAGRLLEGVVGRTWFATIYAVGALSGSIGSMLLNKPNVVAVGASGAIVALFAAIYVCSFHYARTSGRLRLQASAMGVLLPTLLSMGRAGDGSTIDFGAHLGGAMGGALVGLLILRIWRSEDAEPRFRAAAVAVVALSLCALGGSIWPALSAYRTSALLTELVPPGIVPTTDAAFVDRAPDLLRSYPRDPRVHLAMALRLLQSSRWAEAEQEARAGLAQDPRIFRELLERRTESSLQRLLGQALMSQHSEQQALNAFDAAIAVDPLNADAFYWRGVLRFEQGVFDKAHADAAKITSLFPTSPLGPRFEGDILFAEGDPARAIAAFDTAAKLDPSAVTLRILGFAELYAGKVEAAVADLERATAKDPHDLYAALWLDIAKEDQNLPPTISEATPGVLDQRWPAPVARMFAGALSPEGLAALAENKEETCEADYYVGVWDRLHRGRGDALAAFDKAGADCTPAVEESWASRLELKQAKAPL